MAREVICVDTDPDGPDDCRRITNIGYEYDVINSEGSNPPKEVHLDIKQGTDYYVEHDGTETDLIPVEQNGTKYVRTESNDTEDDNLLKQSNC